MLRHLRKVSFVLLFSPLLTLAAEHWIRLSTPHFEMYTTNGEKQGVAALQVFEQVRYFFAEISKSKTAPTTPVRIIAFRSEKEFKPYRLNEGSFAYYVRSGKADFIVMQDISPEHYQAALHEYTHLIVEHAELKLPVWLNEGLADLYSSLEPRGKQALVGRPLEGRVYMLMNQKWLDASTLFSVGPNSPYYNEQDKMSIFYAESWALTHMLALGRDYATGFSKFVAAVSSGQSVTSCLQSVFGKDPNRVIKELHTYITQSSVRGAIFDIKLGKQELDPDVSDASPLSADLALADLLAAQQRTQQEALQRFQQIAAQHPESSEVQESLGYLAWVQGDQPKAKDCFKLAFDRGSKNAEMMAHYAQFLEQSGTPPTEILPVLLKAVELKPDNQDAWYNLGLLQMRNHNYGAALDAVSHITHVTAERAYSLFSLKAYCYLQLKSTTLARQDAERAKQYAKTSDQQIQASSILHQLDLMEHPEQLQTAARVLPNTAPEITPDRPTLRRQAHELARDEPTVHLPNLQHVEAVAQFFECSDKVHRLRVNVDSQTMVFEFRNPESIRVRNKPNGTLELSCGAQKPFNVGIFYLPAEQPSKVDGVILELVF